MAVFCDDFALALTIETLATIGKVIRVYLTADIIKAEFVGCNA